MDFTKEESQNWNFLRNYSKTREGVSRGHCTQVDATNWERRPSTTPFRVEYPWFCSRAGLYTDRVQEAPDSVIHRRQTRSSAMRVEVAFLQRAEGHKGPLASIPDPGTPGPCLSVPVSSRDEDWHHRPAAGGQNIAVQDSDQSQAGRARPLAPGAYRRGARARRAAGQALGALLAEEDDLCVGRVCGRGGHRAGGAEGDGLPDQPAQCGRADSRAARLRGGVDCRTSAPSIPCATSRASSST